MVPLHRGCRHVAQVGGKQVEVLRKPGDSDCTHRTAPCQWVWCVSQWWSCLNPSHRCLVKPVQVSRSCWLMSQLTFQRMSARVGGPV